MAPTLMLKQKRARRPVVFRLEGRRRQEHLAIRSRRILGKRICSSGGERVGRIHHLLVFDADWDNVA
jgi:hypothetical protein